VVWYSGTRNEEWSTIVTEGESTPVSEVLAAQASRPNFAFGDQVRSAITGETGIVTAVALGADGKWSLSVLIKGTRVIEHGNDAHWWTLVRKVQPFMSELEWQKRAAHWSGEELSDERMLGRIEGQLMAAETCLLRLTGTSLSVSRVTEMLGSDIETFPMLIEYLQEKIQNAAEDRA
jgi:hypothetical protein